MFGGSLTTGRCPIGLDLGAHSIKLIQLRRRGDRWESAASASCPVPAELPADAGERVELLGGLIEKLIGSAPFSGRRVVSSLPASSLQYKNIRVPVMPPDELRAAVEWEAADRLKLSQDVGQVQFFNAGAVGQGDGRQQEVVVLAAITKAVEEHVQVLTRAGLQPSAIDADAGGLARLACGGGVSRDGTVLTGAHAVVDLGYSSAKVLIVRDGRVCFFKLIGAGGEAFDGVLAEHLGVSVEEAAKKRLHGLGLAGGGSGEGSSGSDLGPVLTDAVRWYAGELSREIGLCQRYFNVTFRGGGLNSITLAGGEAAIPGLKDSLHAGTGLDVGYVAGPGGMGQIDGRDLADWPEAFCRWAVAAGLSMRVEASSEARGAA